MELEKQIELLKYAIKRAEMNVKRCKYNDDFWEAEKYEYEKHLLEIELKELEENTKTNIE